MIGAGERVKSHPQLDFGQLPVSTRQFAAFSRSHVPTGHGLYPVKTIKLRNSSANFAFFTVSKSNLQSEVVFSPQSGVIGPDGGVLELAVWVVPSFETAQPIEDQIVVNVAGLGKQLTIPVIYNSQAPRVQCSQVGPMKFSCTVGGTDEQTISFKNEGSVAAKVIIDLRKLPGLDLVLAKVIAGQKLASIAPQHNLPIFSRQNTASAPKAKSTEAMFRNLRPGVDDDAIDWCITTQEYDAR